MIVEIVCWSAAVVASMVPIVVKYSYHMYYLVDSDVHEQTLMLFVKMRGSFRSQGRLLAAHHHPEEYYDRYKHYRPGDPYGGYTHQVSLYRGYWVDSGKQVSEVLVEKLIRDRARVDEQKRRLEAGATLVTSYHKDLLKLPAGGE